MKPILFNTEMVKAILEGRKTVTRRVIKPRYRDDEYGWTVCINSYTHLVDDVAYTDGEGACTRSMKPPYQVGDILYIRETWCRGTDIWNCERTSPEYFYKEEFRDASAKDIKWKPSIHMPKEAARIFLKVTDVRVERLQDITEEDAIKEGCEGTPCEHHGYIVGGGMCGCTDCMNTGWLEPPTLEFMDIWHSTINKKDLDDYGWNANPWVWVIEFERIEKGEQ